MNSTSVQITGKIGYHDIHKPDKFSVGTDKPKYSLQMVISDEQLAGAKNLGLDVAKDRAGNPKTLTNLGLEGNVIKGERLESKGKIEVVDGQGNAITGLIGYGSDVTVTGFVSTFTNTYGTFSKLYVDKIIVNNLVEVAPKEEGNVIEASKGAII